MWIRTHCYKALIAVKDDDFIIKGSGRFMKMEVDGNVMTQEYLGIFHRGFLLGEYISNFDAYVALDDIEKALSQRKTVHHVPTERELGILHGWIKKQEATDDQND